MNEFLSISRNKLWNPGQNLWANQLVREKRSSSKLRLTLLQLFHVYYPENSTIPSGNLGIYLLTNQWLKWFKLHYSKEHHSLPSYLRGWGPKNCVKLGGRGRGGGRGGIFYKNGGGWQKARMADFFYCIDHKADTAVVIMFLFCLNYIPLQ